jgi:radical SAM superfamily enzyme YgiQ (UPF0313 family)
MRLLLINPANQLVSILDTRQSRWNRSRVWKPLGLMVIAGLTPDDWEITIVDENLEAPDYSVMPAPDLVGITAFTSQAPRAYELAALFRNAGVPVVIGGIHATMCREEASRYADVVVSGEAENVWQTVLEDFRLGHLEPFYEGGRADMAEVPAARQDLLAGNYAFGAIQTTRGCPLNCSFCSVTSFNGARFRQRPIEQVIHELRQIPEDLVLIVDDNLIGTGRKHIRRAKDLFRAMIRADLKKGWVGQATINAADDDELLTLAAAAGCKGLFIGFESPRPEGARETQGKHKRLSYHDSRAAVRRIQQHGIIVAGSYIIGLDGDEAGIGRLIADTAERIGVDFLNVMFLTPLPGTRLWEELEADNRLALDEFPGDWSYYTLTYPVARYAGLTLAEATREMLDCSQRFYSIPRMLRRVWRNVWRGQSVRISLAGGLSFRKNIRIDRGKLGDFEMQRGSRFAAVSESP